MRALLSVFAGRGTVGGWGLFPERGCFEGKRGLLYKALFFSCLYAPNGRCLIALKPLSTHGYGWINASSRWYVLGSLLLVVLAKIEKKIECLCVAPVGQCFYFGWKFNLFRLVHHRKQSDVILRCISVLCVVRYLPRSLTWVTRHFMWPLSLWMKTAPSPVPGPLTKGGQTAVA